MKKHLEGAAAPFSHFSLCLPERRDDALLAGALDLFKNEQWLDALLAVEQVCRRRADSTLPALLRARIVERCQPQQAARGWYLAWARDPENPALQDALLEAWLSMGAKSHVMDLAVHFLPSRCRSGNQAGLLSLLTRAGMDRTAACWLSERGLEVRLFHLNVAAQAETIHILEPNAGMELKIRPDSLAWVLPRPASGHVFSLAFADGSLLPGSPLIYQTAVSAAKRPASSQAASHAAPVRVVDIVVPVFRGLSHVQRCLGSIINSLPLNQTPARLIVVDDGCPEPKLRAFLDELEANNQCILLRNEHNLGFVEAVNRGMRHSGHHDVMLLNADTEVHGNWLDRLRKSLYRSADIAAVTPWSNNGEISSFPKIAQAAPVPDSGRLARIDDLAATLEPEWQDQVLPACCGFAMLIKRTVLNRVGMLDGAAFFRGYGEEVDWCLRARAAGYHLRLAVHVYISHAGGVSFGMEKVLRVRQNRAILRSRYPDYYPQYHQFLRDDPLAQVRAELLLKTGDAGLELSAQKQSADRVLAQGLPSGWQRIAVWGYEPHTPFSRHILALARHMAGQPESGLRLLVFGHVPETLMHTGVVDVLRPISDSQMLFFDMTFLGLAGCKAILAEPGKWHGQNLRYYQVDDEFDALTFLQQIISDDEPASKSDDEKALNLHFESVLEVN